MSNILSRNTAYYLVIHGVVAILVGLIFAFASLEIFKWIVIAIGIFLIVSGIIILWMSFAGNDSSSNRLRYPAFFQSVLLIAIGVFIVFNVTTMTKMVILAFGLWAVISGGSQIYYGILIRDVAKQSKLVIINGLLLLVIGLVMALSQELFVNIIGKIVGFSSILLGMTTLVFAGYVFFHSRKIKSDSNEDL